MRGLGLGLGLELPRRGVWAAPYGSTLALDFRAGTYLRNGALVAPSVLLTCSRASTGYAPGSAGNWQAFAANALRITNTGLWLEPASTNGIRNNAMQGGGPGVLPTNWISSGSVNGITQTVVGVGSESGVDYVEIRLAGTPTATASWILRFDAPTAIAAASGQTWAGSCFVKLVAGSFANVPQGFVTISGRNSGGAGTADSMNVSFLGATGAPLGTQRLSSVLTLADAASVYAHAAAVIAFNNGAPIDLTFRFGWPQLEQMSWATTPIRTTTAAASRAGDVVTLTDPTLTPLSQGTWLAEWVDLSATGGFGSSIVRQRIDGSNAIGVLHSADGSRGEVNVTIGGVAQAQLQSANALVANSIYRCAAALASNDVAAAFSAALSPSILTDASVSMPAGTPVVGIGNGGNGGQQLGGAIRRLAWSPNRVANADLLAWAQSANLDDAFIQ